jgi:hypothetical protein
LRNFKGSRQWERYNASGLFRLEGRPGELPLRQAGTDGGRQG